MWADMKIVLFNNTGPFFKCHFKIKILQRPLQDSNSEAEVGFGDNLYISRIYTPRV